MKPAVKLGTDVMAAIGNEPRLMYREIIAEGVPEHFCRDPAQAGRSEQRGLEK
jgi:hypothetical protein